MEIFLFLLLANQARGYLPSTTLICKGHYVHVFVATSNVDSAHSTRSQMNIEFIGEKGRTNKYKLNDQGWELRVGDVDQFNIPITAKHIQFIGQLTAIEISTSDSLSNGWRGANIDIEIPYNTANACFMVKASFSRWTEDRLILYKQPMILYPTDIYILDHGVKLPIEDFDEKTGSTTTSHQILGTEKVTNPVTKVTKVIDLPLLLANYA